MMHERFIEVFPVVLFIGFMGYAARKKNVLTEHSLDGLIKVVRLYLLPCLAFYTVVWYAPELNYVGPIFFVPLFAVYAAVLGMLSGSLFLPFIDNPDPQKSRTFLHLAIVCNFQFLPLPFISFMYGDAGLALYFLFVFGMLFGASTIGIWILKNDIEFKSQIQLLARPLFIAIAIAYIGGLYIPVRLIPKVILNTAEMAGKASLPIGVFITGAALAETGTPRNIPAALLLTVVRCICYPAFVIMSLTMLPETIIFNDMVFNSALLCLCMPASIIAPRLYRKINAGDPSFAQTAIFYTTVASIITVPVIYILFAR